MRYNRALGRFESRAALEAAILGLLLTNGEMRTSAVGRALGPVTYHFAARCGHDDCTRPSHTDTMEMPYHPADIVRPALNRMAKAGWVVRVEEDKVPLTRGHLWRVGSGGQVHSFPDPAEVERRAQERAAARRMAEAQREMEELLGPKP